MFSIFVMIFYILIIMECSEPTQRINRDKCYAQWPYFPCYDKNQKACYSPDGVQLFDPVGDVMDVAIRSYKAAFDFVTRVLGSTPPRLRGEADRKLAERLYTWGPTTLQMVPATTAITKASEGGPLAPRHYNARDLERQIIDGRETLRQIGNTVRNVLQRIPEQIQQPLLERQPSEERIAEGRCTHKKRTRKRRKRRKQYRTRSKLYHRHYKSRKKRQRKRRTRRK